MSYAIEIEGMVKPVEIHEVREYGDDVVYVKLDDGTEYYVCADSDAAGTVVRERWQEMAEYDPAEFRRMVGDDNLISWSLGKPAGPGTAKVRSLSEWLDVGASVPEEELASYDGEERAVLRISPGFASEYGFEPTVAYRAN